MSVFNSLCLKCIWVEVKDNKIELFDGNNNKMYALKNDLNLDNGRYFREGFKDTGSFKSGMPYIPQFDALRKLGPNETKTTRKQEQRDVIMPAAELLFKNLV